MTSLSLSSTSKKRSDLFRLDIKLRTKKILLLSRQTLNLYYTLVSSGISQLIKQN